MTPEAVTTKKGPRSIYNLMILTQSPGIVDDLLYETFDTEDDLRQFIETRGFKMGEDSPAKTPPELKNKLENFPLSYHKIIDGQGYTVAGLEVLTGDRGKLQELNKIIEEWRENRLTQN